MTSKPHILLIGPVAEPVLALVSARLAKRDCSLVFLNFQRPAHEWPISFSFLNHRKSGSLTVEDRNIPLELLRSTYVRMIDRFSQVVDGDEYPADQPHHPTLYPSLLGWLPGLVVNPHQAACANGSKPYQQLLLSRLGFRVPKTLITTDPHAVKQFFYECEEKVIYKSISAERSIVKRVVKDDLARLDQIQHCPVQFQQYVPGIDFRVHVVGRRVFASQVETSSIDYRYVEEDGFCRIRAVELSTELEESCVALAEGLGLVLAGIDLRRAMDGSYYCLK